MRNIDDDALTVYHTIPPVFREDSKVLILGSFPSVKSREQAFYYGHSKNRFWNMLSCICEEVLPETVEDKRDFLLRHRIALWDVIASCTVHGSADASISSVTLNNISQLIQNTDIQRILLNGKTAWHYFSKNPDLPDYPQAVCMPSTSPANASWSFERLTARWREELKVLLTGESS